MLKVNSLTSGYGKRKVIENISFSAKNGDMVYIIGANGSGKTTLLNNLIGYKSFWSGSIEYDGKGIEELSIADRAKLVSYIPQHHVPAFNYSVRDVVIMGRAGRLSFFDTPKKSDYVLADDALKMLGIGNFGDKDYTRLSGGERQLVLIARAICQQSEVIIMDEPMQSLDFVNQAMVQRASRLLTLQGRCVIMSTHTTISNYEKEDKVLLVNKDGTALFGGIEHVLIQRNAEIAYGSNLELIYNTDRTGGRHITCLPTVI